MERSKSRTGSAVAVRNNLYPAPTARNLTALSICPWLISKLNGNFLKISSAPAGVAEADLRGSLGWPLVTWRETTVPLGPAVRRPDKLLARIAVVVFRAEPDTARSGRIVPSVWPR